MSLRPYALVMCAGAVVCAVPLAARAQASASAQRVLAAARRAMGAAGIARIRTIATVADCRGPRRPYHTTVFSARDGRAVFEQDFAHGQFYRAGLSPTGDWEYDSDTGRYSPASVLTRTIVEGHEVHLLTIAPEVIYGDAMTARDSLFQGRAAIAVSFRDALGGAVAEFFAQSDSLPLGFLLPNHRDAGAEPVLLVLSRWRTIAEVRMPTRAVYWQGHDAYRFRFTQFSC